MERQYRVVNKIARRSGYNTELVYETGTVYAGTRRQCEKFVEDNGNGGGWSNTFGSLRILPNDGTPIPENIWD